MKIESQICSLAEQKVLDNIRFDQVLSESSAQGLKGRPRWWAAAWGCGSLPAQDIQWSYKVGCERKKQHGRTSENFCIRKVFPRNCKKKIQTDKIWNTGEAFLSPQWSTQTWLVWIEMGKSSWDFFCWILTRLRYHSDGKGYRVPTVPWLPETKSHLALLHPNMEPLLV